MNALAALILAACATFALRLGSVRLLANRSLPDVTETVLRYAALGIISSLMISELPNGPDAGHLEPAVVVGLGIAGRIAVIAARRLSNVASIIGVAVASYALID